MTSARRDARFHILHTTEYVYTEPVTASLHHAVLGIRETPHQRASYTRITVDPEPDDLVTATDYFGNNRTRFSIGTKSTGLRVDAESEVCLSPSDRFDLSASLPLDSLLRSLRGGGSHDRAALEFIFGSHYVSRSGDLAAYAAGCFTDGDGFLVGVERLMHRIYREFKYDATVTEVSTPVEDVLVRKEGVCQDFAHFMIGCLRSSDIPARYVSGYLVPLPGVVGAQASHAWVSVYSPRLGWIDFDPTNRVLPTGGHITVAWGRDFGDVSPLRGVVLGGGEHTVEVSVKVEEVTGTSTKSGGETACP